MTIAPGPIAQLSWVVRDLDAMEGLLASQFSTGKWTRLPNIRFGPDTCTYRDEPCDAVADISMAYSGDLQLELIRPVSGDSVWSEFLTAHGPGLHHVCFYVADMAAALDAANAEGLEVVMSGVMAGPMEFAYVDGSAYGAPYVELARISPAMEEFFAAIKAGA